MFSIPVMLDKDNWDKAVVIATICSVLISFISIWFIYWCSSIRADIIKKRNEERCLLDYMLIVVHRYLTYMIKLRSTLDAKITNLVNFVQDPDNVEKRKHAFGTIALLQNLEMDLAKYDFTIKTQPNIVDDIINFQHIYQHIMTGVEHMNNVSNRCIPIIMPQDKVIETAKELLSEGRDIYTLDIMISTAAVILSRVFDNINRYKLNNNHKDHMKMILTNEEISEINNMKLFLNTVNYNEWRYCLNDIEPLNNEHWFLRFCHRIFNVKNENQHKVLYLLGFKIKFRMQERIKEEAITELHDILQKHSEQFVQIDETLKMTIQNINIFYNEIVKKFESSEKDKTSKNTKTKSKKTKKNKKID